MGADTIWQSGEYDRRASTPRRAARFVAAAVAVAAGAAAQVALYYFWQVACRGLVGPMLLPFGRRPEELVALLLPFVGGLVAASFHPRGWWWLGQGMAFPALLAAHLLYAGGIQLAHARPPTMHEELQFLTSEGFRLLAGFIGSYFGALSQRE